MADSIRVLMIDDDRHSYIIARENLRDVSPNGFSVDWAKNYQEGLDALRRHEHDIYLLDWRLGADDGLDLLREAMKDGCREPIVMLTGLGVPNVDVQALQAGAADYLVKDHLTPDSLSRAIRYAVERSRALAQLERRSRELEASQKQLQSIEEQFRVAGDVQKRLFPRKFPSINGYDIAGRCEPAEATGGDYFDFIQLPDGSWDIVVGDVSGHGLGPALVMVETRAVLRTLATSHDDVGEILRKANDILSPDLGDKAFVALVLMRLDPIQRTIRYAGAGHHAFVLDAEGKLTTTLKPNGPPLNVLEQFPYQTGEVQLGSGEMLVSFTDGITDNSSKAPEFPIERVFGHLAERRLDPAKTVIDSLFQAVRIHTGNAPQDDDMTAVVMKVL